MDKNLRYIKDRKGWTITDQNGNSATGATRDAAYNQYILLYELNKTSVDTDMRKYGFNPFQN